MFSSVFFKTLANASLVMAIIFFFFSLMQLAQRDKLLSNYLLSSVYCAIAVQNFSLWLYVGGNPIFYRYFLYSDTAFLYLIGPFLFLYFKFMAGEIHMGSKEIARHSLPFGMVMTIITFLNLLYPDKEVMPFMALYPILALLSYLSLLVYQVFIFKILYSHYVSNGRPREIRALMLIVAWGIIFSLPLILSVGLIQDLQFIAHIAFFCIPLFFVFFLVRYPDYFNSIHREIRETKYSRSQLKNMDRESIGSRIESLMEKKKIYRDADLTIGKLSERTSLSSLQLSELINSHYGTNFNNFINAYRIGEVKERLASRGDESILEIAFASGFNSKTTFNTVFKKATGMTPTQYRRRRAPLPEACPTPPNR